jgi:hypothetical protein
MSEKDLKALKLLLELFDELDYDITEIEVE